MAHGFRDEYGQALLKFYEPIIILSKATSAAVTEYENNHSHSAFLALSTLISHIFKIYNRLDEAFPAISIVFKKVLIQTPLSLAFMLYRGGFSFGKKSMNIFYGRILSTINCDEIMLIVETAEAKPSGEINPSV
jgi:hypothetical protein